MRPVPERQAAKLNGDAFYHTGKPCRNGHIGKRSTATGNCCQCNTEKTQRFQAKGIEHPERTAARAKGQRHYSLGKPCQNGHESNRYVSNGICVKCEAGKHGRWLAVRPGMEAKWARERRAKNPSSHRAEVKRWAQKNKDKVKAAFNIWKKQNIDHVRETGRIAMAIRRSRVAKNGGRFTADDIARIYQDQGEKCAGCTKYFRREDMEIDHIIPVFLGGSSDPFNLQLLCLPCNRSKGKKDPAEWLRSLSKN